MNWADGDPTPTFTCTGTVVYHEGSATWIMTSAALIRKHGSDTEVHEARSAVNCAFLSIVSCVSSYTMLFWLAD
jgi:hypothetical protein